MRVRPPVGSRVGIGTALVASAFCLALSASPALADLDPARLPVVAYQPSGIAYWDRPYFANALAGGEGWSINWTGVPIWNNPQFDVNGYPRYLDPGQVLIGILSGLHAGYGEAPPGWPDTLEIFRGHVVLTWQGNADIRLNAWPVTYLAEESSGPETGSLLNGRRVYRVEEPAGWIEVHEIQTPVTGIKVWLPDPADPQNRSLENQLFHPALLARLADAPWGFIRFMDWNATNASPVQDWSDRRLPTHAFSSGVLNPRPPATGFDGNRGTGVAYEHMVALANAAQQDLWINIPHLATDDFVTRLAQLVRFGSDGVNPYTSEVPDPVWPPLDPGLQVFVEYSNEIWSGGDAFAQGNWAEARALALGISKAQFNARRFCDTWRLFQQVFGGSSRVVRVAAAFTAVQDYTTDFLTEMRNYGAGLTPAVEPDLIAPTTYFGNGIQDWAHQQAQDAAGSADPWFYTTETFDAGGGVLHPVSLPPSDPYWAGAAFARHRLATLAEWKRRMLAGSASQGGGPDATGLGGGFDVWLANLARTAFPQPKPLVAYEGGPSLYTNYLDWGDPRDDGITWFVSALNREPGLREIYDIHLNMARSKGLRTHSAFVDCATWSKWGQWGHLEYLDQPLAQAPKYAFILDHVTEMSALRPVDDPLGLVPSFSTAETLPPARYGRPYSLTLQASGGDGALSAKVVGTSLAPGLSAEPAAGGAVLVHGTPLATGYNYVYVRVHDADGDPAWRIFTLYVAGGPGALIDSDFRGTSPGLNTPWTPTYFRSPRVTDHSGWRLGPGAQGGEGDDRLAFAFDTPGDPAPLAYALQHEQYLSLSLRSGPRGLQLRRGKVRFTIERLDYHAPRRYAVFTSVRGFAEGQEVYVSPELTDLNEPREFTLALPDQHAYDVARSLEIRIYGFAGQWGGHHSSLTAFQVSTRPLLLVQQ